MKRIITVLLVFAAGMMLGWLVLSLAGCHTIHGFGSDLKDWSSKYVERDK